MPTLETAIIYPGMCLIEGTNLSEGRGSDSPFLTIGAPYIDAQLWLEAIPEEAKTGVEISPVTFLPRAIENVASNPKYKDEQCSGLHFKIADRDSFDPIKLTVAALCAAQKLFPKNFRTTQYMDKLWGNENLRAMLAEGRDYKTILKTCRVGVERFLEIREKYLRYR